MHNMPSLKCFLVSDIHGRISLYQRLFQEIEREKPDGVFIAGDILPSGLHAFTGRQKKIRDFLQDYLIPGFLDLRKKMQNDSPDIFLILGNDDGAAAESRLLKEDDRGLWHYLHHRWKKFHSWNVAGYSYVPPTPFALKDWEKYDVSRYVDPGCSHPSEGMRTVKRSAHSLEYSTISEDLDNLAGIRSLKSAILLFHSPPYRTRLDRAALDGKKIDHVPLDVHVGSIAIRRFIENKQPAITLHGHVHESSRLTGSWRDRLGASHLFTGAREGDRLSLVVFDPHHPGEAYRKLL